MRHFVLLAWAVLLPSAAMAQTPLANVDAYRARPLEPGAWRFSQSASSSEAVYAEAGRPARLIVRCDLVARRVRITRPDIAPGPITIITSSLTRTLAAPGEVTVYDPLLDAIAFSRGRFVVTTPASAAVAGNVLVVPAWPEAARIAEDCRK